MNTQISYYDNAKFAIAQYESIDEVKDYIDKAAAVQEYAKRANDYDIEHKAAKARVRAERRCGEILKDMEKAKGGQPYQSNGVTSREPEPTLNKMGLSKNQSSKFQQLANVPESEFEDALADEGRIPSAHNILKTRESKSEQKRINRDALYLWGQLIDIEKKLFPLDIIFLLEEMTPAMQGDAERIIPIFQNWLER